MSSDPLPQLTRAIVDAFAPLGTVLSDARLAAGLLAELGVDVALDQGDLDRIAALLTSLPRVTAELVPMAERLAAGEELDAGDALTAVEVADAVRRDLETLSQGPSAGAVSGLPGPLDDPATWTAIGAALPGSLIAGWIESALPPVHAPLRLGGVVRDTYDAHGRRHREVGWGRLGDLVRDPAGTIGDEYGWGGDLDHLPLLGAIRDAARAIGLRLRWGLLPSELIAPWYPDGPPSAMRALILGLGPAGEVGVAALPIPAEPGARPHARPGPGEPRRARIGRRARGGARLGGHRQRRRRPGRRARPGAAAGGAAEGHRGRVDDRPRAGAGRRARGPLDRRRPAGRAPGHAVRARSYRPG